MSTIRCTVIEGFKRGRGFALPGQEIDLPIEEYEALKKAGAVADPNEIRQQQQANADERIRLLTAFLKRDPTDRELAEVAHVSPARLGEQLDTQRKAQEEWERAMSERETRRLAYEQQKAEADEARHQKLADRARGKRPRAG